MLPNGTRNPLNNIERPLMKVAKTIATSMLGTIDATMMIADAATCTCYGIKDEPTKK